MKRLCSSLPQVSPSSRSPAPSGCPISPARRTPRRPKTRSRSTASAPSTRSRTRRRCRSAPRRAAPPPRRRSPRTRDAMRKIINALRQAGGRELATQWVSVYPYTDETGERQRLLGVEQRVRGERRRRRAGADRRGRRGRREPDLRARAQLVATPRRCTGRRSRRPSPRPGSMPRRSRRRPAARSATITAIVEGGAVDAPSRSIAERRRPPTPPRPIVPGEQETSATVSVTFSLR